MHAELNCTTMYIRCEDGDSVYIIDTAKNQVYEIIEGEACLMGVDSDNFMRFNPYLESIEETKDAPKEIKEYRERHNASK